VDSKDWSILALAKRQRGVITDAQAIAVGFNTGGSIRWRLGVGEWTRVLPGVVRLYWADDSWETRCMAAALWAGASGALSHVTAAALHRFDVEPQEIVHVSTTRGRGRVNTGSVKSHRVCHQIRAMTVSGLRVTPPARTMVDLATMVDAIELERLLRLALRNGQIERAEMQAELSRLTQGNRGGRKLQRIFNGLVRVPTS
jgi:hypothetical protein